VYQQAMMASANVPAPKEVAALLVIGDKTRTYMDMTA
jgi:hypothetical protein